ncbi:MAG: hypothetical protein SOI26_10755 [Coriobacteriales bacterium]|jgi:hypothetical protein
MNTDDTTRSDADSGREQRTSDASATPTERAGAAEGVDAAEGNGTRRGAVERDGRGVPEHVERKTLADEEMEHIREKREAGNALDPLALEDPTGRSVEHVVMRVGIVIILILVVGILFVQVACKNMQLSSVPNFTEGTTTSSIETALKHGTMFGGEVVSFPDNTTLESFDESTGTITICYEDDSARSIDQLLASVQSPTMALAMNAFEDPNVTTVTVKARSHVDGETGEFSGSKSDPIGDVLTITWTRDYGDPESYSCSITGYTMTGYGSSDSGAQDGGAGSNA